MKIKIRHIAQIITLITITAVSNTLYAQWKEVDKEQFKKVIEKIDGAMSKHSSYSYKTHYRFYDQLTDDIPKASYAGSVRCENKANFEIRMIDQLILQNEKLNVTIDTIAKYIIIKKADSTLSSQKTAMDYAGFLQSETKVYEQKNKTGTTYKLEFPPDMKYKSIEITINAKGQVIKYNMYAGQQIPGNQWDESPTLQPRMEIDYSEYRIGTSPTPLRQQNEFIIEKEGKQYLTAAYSAYTLIDLRIKNEQQ